MRGISSIMFDKKSLLRRLQELPFSKNEYWVVAGGAMVLHGFRTQTHDIDLWIDGGRIKFMFDQGALYHELTQALVLRG